MKKIIYSLIIIFFFSNISLANVEFENIIIDKISSNGKKVCEDEGFGNHSIQANLVTFADISNDGIFDVIIDTKNQRCEKSYSWFAGGTGGSEFIFFINPTIDIINQWDPSKFINEDKENRIFSILIRGYKIVPWNFKNALEISSHGISCNVDGATGCWSILNIKETGFENIFGPYPNDIIIDNNKNPLITFSSPDFYDGKTVKAPLTKKNKKILEANNIKFEFLKGKHRANREVRNVVESNSDTAWEVEGKFIIPECFITLWISGDNYEEFFDKYKIESTHLNNEGFNKFTQNIGLYLNKEVPLNHIILPDWQYTPYGISLTKNLNNCLSEKPENKIYNITYSYFDDGEEYTSESEIGYEVLETLDINIAKKLAPNIKTKFDSIKKIRVADWGGGSMGHTFLTVTYGLLEIDGRKLILPLKNHIKFP